MNVLEICETACSKSVLLNYYRPQTKFAKVMFLQVSVCPRRGACVVGGGACVVGGGHVWLVGGMCGCRGDAWLLTGGACVVARGGMSGERGHAW